MVAAPAAAPLHEEHPRDGTSLLEAAIQAESYERYRKALEALKPRDREMIVARVEVQWSLTEIAQRFGLRAVDAARMAVSRALQRLSAHMSTSHDRDVYMPITSTRSFDRRGGLPERGVFVSRQEAKSAPG